MTENELRRLQRRMEKVILAVADQGYLEQARSYADTYQLISQNAKTVRALFQA